MGYRVLQGGGAGLMMALRIGSDLFCQNLTALEHVVALMCEAKTASNDRQQEIKSLITEQYATCQPRYSHSLHGAFWLTRMPVKPYIGFGAERTELYDKYNVLGAMAQQADIWIAAPGGSGTMVEFASTLQERDYSYLNPDKKQHLIVFNTTAWEYNKQVHSEKLYRFDTQHANTAEEVVEHTNTFVRERFCSTESVLHTCPSALYQQSKRGSQAVEAKQNRLAV
jgi:predicted Rossmann-fold nucleotide-binding protein